MVTTGRSSEKRNRRCHHTKHINFPTFSAIKIFTKRSSPCPAVRLIFSLHTSCRLFVVVIMLVEFKPILEKNSRILPLPCVLLIRDNLIWFSLFQKCAFHAFVPYLGARNYDNKNTIAAVWRTRNVGDALLMSQPATVKPLIVTATAPVHPVLGPDPYSAIHHGPVFWWMFPPRHAIAVVLSSITPAYISHHPSSPHTTQHCGCGCCYSRCPSASRHRRYPYFFRPYSFVSVAPFLSYSLLSIKLYPFE